jgi:hypothetical protein
MTTPEDQASPQDVLARATAMATYPNVKLPNLIWDPTTACSPRHGSQVSRVVIHRWGERYVSEAQEAKTYQGVRNYFKNRGNGASAHIVYPGKDQPTAQMVRWADMAWTQAAYNPTSDEVESSDELWLAPDPEELQQLARIVAFRLHVRGLPPVWSHERGFCRHADLGQAGGGHLQCPTTDLAVWRHFVLRVQYEFHRGGFRPVWGV